MHCFSRRKSCFISLPGKIIQAAEILTAACNYEIIFVQSGSSPVFFNNRGDYDNDGDHCDNSYYNAFYHKFCPLSF